MKFNEKLEHPMDRLKRVCDFVKFNINVTGRDILSNEFCEGFEYSTNKKEIYIFRSNPFTKLIQCDVCGIFSTPKKVQYRPCITNWNLQGKNDYVTEKKDTLCMGCYNKVRPISKKLDELEYLIKLTKSINRKLNESTKNNARTS